MAPRNLLSSYLLPIEANTAQIFELGWQSWSPSGSYSVLSTSPRPKRDIWETMAFRPGFVDPKTEGLFVSDGWLIVDPGDGTPIITFEGANLPEQVPHITAKLLSPETISIAGQSIHLGRQLDTIPGSSALKIEANEELIVRAWPSLSTISQVLDELSRQYANGLKTTFKSAIEPAWCSWYCYWTSVTAADIISEAEKINAKGLNVKTIQIDDGWQIDLGNWRPSDRFGDLDSVIKTVKSAGYDVGIWVAPFLIGENSTLLTDNPEFTAPNMSAGFNWQQKLFVANLKDARLRRTIVDTFKFLVDKGVSYFKLDFLYAGLISSDPSTALYREVLSEVREVVGKESKMVGCGAPLLPSVGLFDAMRISPDIAPHWNPPLQDVSQPGSRAAIANARSRAPLHGNLWINDHDCALTRPSIMARELIAHSMEGNGGLRTFSDPIDTLDDWAFNRLSQLLRTSSLEKSTPQANSTLSIEDLNSSTITIADHEKNQL
ncbi:MAG: alpha-galactosidase [Actinomycetota bacterium]|nr:alpha-galactosidase [Actinomycetota bacterium]